MSHWAANRVLPRDMVLDWRHSRSETAFGALPGHFLGRRFRTPEALISGLCDWSQNLPDAQHAYIQKWQTLL